MALREKYSVKNLNKKNNYSSFWLDDGWDTTSSIFDDEVEVNKKPKVDLVALAGYRRAVSNFVSIVTGDSSIKVNFTSRDDSYTDGKTVTIGSKLDDKLFDSSVGLALHEGSHIKLSDFDFLKNLEMNIPKEYYNRAEVKGFSKGEILTHLKNLLNYVEDRRIDHFIFTTSPGYKGYYHSMYDKYFHSKVVDKALKSTEYTSKDWDSYIFRIINLTNKNTNLDALPGLREIRKLIFGTVKSMESTGAAFGIALQIYDTILNNIPDGTEKVDNETGVVTPLQYIAVQDVGFAINPMLIEGQMHGGVLQGLGWALWEEMPFDLQGQLLASNFLDYVIPRSNDSLDIECVIVENPSPEGPLGIRGVGEPPIVPGAAAVANAVREATGIRCEQLPIRPQSLWTGMKEA